MKKRNLRASLHETTVMSLEDLEAMSLEDLKVVVRELFDRAVKFFQEWLSKLTTSAMNHIKALFRWAKNRNPNELNEGIIPNFLKPGIDEIKKIADAFTVVTGNIALITVISGSVALASTIISIITGYITAAGAIVLKAMQVGVTYVTGAEPTIGLILILAAAAYTLFTKRSVISPEFYDHVRSTEFFSDLKSRLKGVEENN